MQLLDRIERLGNRLPDPATLFAVGALALLPISALGSHLGLSAIHPRTGEPTEIISLLWGDGLAWVWTSLVSNFTGFPPLGVVLTAVLGLGVAERTGLVGALLARATERLPQPLLVPGVLFMGVMSSLGADAGFIILPPLAAALFASSGRAPVVGVYTAWAGVAGGFSANLFLTSLDPMLSGATQQAARLLMPGQVVHVTANYFFLIVSTFLVVGVGWWVTTAIVEPRYSREDIAAQLESGRLDDDADPLERGSGRGLLAAAASLAAVAAGLAVLVVPEGAPLSGTTALAPGVEVPTWSRALVPMLFVFFLVPGLMYGWVAGTIRSDRDVADMMADSMRSLGPYVVLAFFCGQFVAWFAKSGIGTVLAIRGIEALVSLELPGLVLVVSIVLLTAALNLFIGSASAKWFLLAPVFVPLFMGLGISPELTQAAFRVGDSATNPMAPLNPYIVVIIMYARRWVPTAGLGTVVGSMAPWSIAYLIAWTTLLLAWAAFGFPLGPDNGPLFTPAMASPSG